MNLHPVSADHQLRRERTNVDWDEKKIFLRAGRYNAKRSSSHAAASTTRAGSFLQFPLLQPGQEPQILGHTPSGCSQRKPSPVWSKLKKQAGRRLFSNGRKCL